MWIKHVFMSLGNVVLQAPTVLLPWFLSCARGVAIERLLLIYICREREREKYLCLVFRRTMAGVDTVDHV